MQLYALVEDAIEWMSRILCRPDGSRERSLKHQPHTERLLPITMGIWLLKTPLVGDLSHWRQGNYYM
jgi:hypothetical protein